MALFPLFSANALCRQFKINRRKSCLAGKYPASGRRGKGKGVRGRDTHARVAFAGDDCVTTDGIQNRSQKSTHRHKLPAFFVYGKEIEIHAEQGQSPSSFVSISISAGIYLAAIHISLSYRCHQ